MTDAELLRDRFGFEAFRPGQREVLEALESRKAALGVFPTGAGKSLCYQLPALRQDGVTLVVSPLIALMKDQIDFLASRGIPARRLDSSLQAAEGDAVVEELRTGAVKLLYVAPERFNNERFLSLLASLRIALFAVDEAHCISEWGHNFRPDYLKLAEARRDVRAERVLGLTATATPAVVRDICAAFGIPRECAIVTGFYRPNLTLLTTPVGHGERDALLLERLRTRPPGPTIVYTTLQKSAERVAERLAQAGLKARAYHAGLETDQRTAIQDWWMASDDAVVVATIAFGMGIDKAGVRYVYHYNLPKSLESYSQEIGRAGRDSRARAQRANPTAFPFRTSAPATVELLACRDDVPTLENFAYGDTPSEAALRALCDHLLGLGDEFDVSVSELAFRCDIRVLVLRTALTYLELAGVLRQGTPFYAAYELKPALPPEAIAGRFEGERATFIASLFSAAKKGRLWYSFDPAHVARALGAPRERVVRALEYLQQQGLGELRVADVRQRYRRLRPAEDAAALVGRERSERTRLLSSSQIARELCDRFARREQQEIARVAEVLALCTRAGCQVNALCSHFGEQRAAPCGHCTFCLTGRPQTLPPPEPAPALPAGLDVAAVRTLRDEHPAALGEPRQLARFLCGLSSPALSRARLTRHPLFGALEDRSFASVLVWCAGLDAR